LHFRDEECVCKLTEESGTLCLVSIIRKSFSKKNGGENRRRLGEKVTQTFKIYENYCKDRLDNKSNPGRGAKNIHHVKNIRGEKATEKCTYYRGFAQGSIAQCSEKMRIRKENLAFREGTLSTNGHVHVRNLLSAKKPKKML